MVLRSCAYFGRDQYAVLRMVGTSTEQLTKQKRMKAYDLTAAELENSELSRKAEKAGYASLKSLLNDHSLWSKDVSEVEAFLDQQINDTVTLVNPWSKARVEKPVTEIVANINAYPWPDALRDELHKSCDNDSDWVREAVERLGAEEAGRIIIGS